MNSTIQSFKDKVFEGTIALTKKVLPQYFILNILLTILSFTIIIPLFAYGLGFSIERILNFKAEMKTIANQIKENSENPIEVFKEIFANINYGIIALTAFLAVIINIIFYTLFYQTNEKAIKEEENEMSSILKGTSFSMVLRLFNAYLLLVILIIGSLALVMVIVALISKIHIAIGIILGLVALPFWVLTLMRLVLVVPALMHGSMTFQESMAFSFKNITFKRAALLLLFGFVFFIGMAIVSGIFVFLINLVIKPSEIGQINWINIVVVQIINIIIGVLSTAFMLMASSALFYRYLPTDEIDIKIDINEHIVS